jgi:hypothetical protein
MGRAGGPKKLPKTAPETKREGWIEERLARGQRPTAVCLAAVEEWGISEATAWRYIAAVRDRWAAEAPADRSKARAEVLAQVDHLIAKAFERNDFKTVKNALSLKAEVHGLKLRSVVVTDASGTLTPEERAALVAGLDGAGGPRDGS